MTVPTQEPLEQFFTVDYQLTNIKINGKSLLLQTININEKFPFTYPINADDKIDITIKNVISQTCLKGEIKYYDKEGVVRKLDTNYLGWICNEKPAIKIGNGYNNIMKISLNKGNGPTGAS